MSFVHLRNYSEYTIPDGSMKIDALVTQAAALGMDAVALTDRGTLAGAVEFHQACKRVGVKPIIGLEVDARLRPPSGVAQVVTLTLLAANAEGWGSLCSLSSQMLCAEEAAAITEDELRAASAGLICLVASTEGAVAGALQAKRVNIVQEILVALTAIFDDDSLYLEIQNRGRPVESAVLPEVIKVGNDTGVPLVATNTCLFAASDDAQPYCLIRSIRSGQSEVEAHEAYASCFMKSPAEMGSVFADLAEAVENTSRIAARCNVDLVKPMSDPPIDMPAEFATADAYLSSLAKQGLSGRIDNSSRVYEERLDHELRIIRDMKVAAYFIFVLKYAQLAKDLGFLTCERGSSSASLVHYALGITTLDPIKWGLYFERFLNPERCWSSVPDLDLDIEGEGRLRVMEALKAELSSDEQAT